MNRRSLIFAAALAALSSPVGADEAVNKLLAAHEQSLRSARLPLHRKLMNELQKLQTQYQKARNDLALSEANDAIARVKDWIAEASQPVGAGAGPQPGDFKLIYYNGEVSLFGAWENGDLKVENRGFSWVNKSAVVEVINTRVLTGAFEAEISYTGSVYAFSAMEADYTKYAQMFFHPPVDDQKHTIKVKRTAAGVMTAELDKKPVALMPANNARQDMYVRLSLRMLKGAKLELHEMNIKDLSAKK